ncbi:hypothetical protein, partial [Mesorhizobium sp. M7A.F.Ca.CA.002.04.1.1]
MSAFAPMAALPSLGKNANRPNAGSSNESAPGTQAGCDIYRVDDRLPKLAQCAENSALLAIG